VADKVRVTLRLDAALVREARILAAAEGTSVSRLLAARLEELSALARLREGHDLGWHRPASRDDLHQR
jgi:hypothetical protein